MEVPCFEIGSSSTCTRLLGFRLSRGRVGRVVLVKVGWTQHVAVAPLGAHDVDGDTTFIPNLVDVAWDVQPILPLPVECVLDVPINVILIMENMRKLFDHLVLVVAWFNHGDHVIVHLPVLLEIVLHVGHDSTVKEFLDMLTCEVLVVEH